MSDSLDLRKRIHQMRKSNNLIVNEKNSLNNNLMSKFESSIKDDNYKKSNFREETKNNIKKELVSSSYENNPKNITLNKEHHENKDFKSPANNNEAQFLMLANKFNEAVEVILELSQKVEKLEKILRQDTHKQKKTINHSFLFNVKLLIFLLLVPIIILSFFTLPFDFSLIKSIMLDIFSNI